VESSGWRYFAKFSLFVAVILAGLSVWTRYALSHGGLSSDTICDRTRHFDDGPVLQTTMDGILAYEVIAYSGVATSSGRRNINGITGSAALIGIVTGYSRQERREMAMTVISRMKRCEV